MKEIKEKNIIRSKLECQRIAKANMNEWKTFITLTFAENETDIKQANKKFRYFVDKVQRVKKDFKYICIPEFQKRGAIHYHMLCNIDINDKKLIYKEFDKLFNKFQDSILVVSYRSDGIPSESELKELICQYKTNVKIKKYGNYKYALSKNKKSEELLFIGE